MADPKNDPPVVVAIALSVAGSGGTEIVRVTPSKAWVSVPSGVPSAIVNTGIPAAFALAAPSSGCN